MRIPVEWMAEAGVQGFRPPPAQRGFRCDDEHQLVALCDIERPTRRSDYPLDANGFRRERMLRILAGIRDNFRFPPSVSNVLIPGSDGIE
jgi:hypothetical protein